MSKEEPETKQPKAATTEKTVECRVTVARLELPHGVAAKGAVVRLKECDYQEHKKDGNVAFLRFI